MPIDLPNLDDRTYVDLVQEALALIPGYAPEWTNHNPSDPGITLIEMFAFLTEMLIYRLNRVTDANQLAFLKLLNPPGWEPNPEHSLNQSVQATVLRLRDEQRAVTVADFERLALAAASPVIARVYCLPRRNLESGLKGAARLEAPGHVSVVLVPAPDTLPELSGITSVVKTYLEPRCLLTTRLHVVTPAYLKINVRLALRPSPDAQTQEAVEASVKAAVKVLTAYFDPLTGGTDGGGWPLGRNAYISEVYAILDKVPGIDGVEPKLDKTGNPQDELVCDDNERRLFSGDGKQFTGIRLEPNELVRIEVNEKDLRIIKTMT